MVSDLAPNMNYRLSPHEIAELRPYGEVRRHEKGDLLFDEGDREVDLCIVLSGQLDVYLFEDGERRRVGWLEPSQFTGDVSMITGQSSLVRGEMQVEGEVLHVSQKSLQRLLVERSELSDAFVTTFIARRAWARASGRASVVIIGFAFDRAAFAIRDLLSRHSVPHIWVEADADPKAATILERLQLTAADTPVLVTGSKTFLKRPSLGEVSKTLGLDLLPDGACADIIIIGAGPAGLASSVYAASEGLSVVAIDAVAPGGQAGSSSKIENYLGFPSGVSGRELAERASVQAQKFGARIAAPASVETLEKLEGDYCVTLVDGRKLMARSVVVASGAEYRKLPIDNIEQYEGSGIYYGATAMEAQLCKGSKIAIVGAGNSAGQGAVFLSSLCEEVHLLYRRPSIRDTMSEYLVRRLEETPNIFLHGSSSVSQLEGDGKRLRRICIKSGDEEEWCDAPFLFLFIGAKPCTDWLDPLVARDEDGFLRTGHDIHNIELVRAGWPLDRMPTLYETNWPRVYAVGDVRSGSVKRVAAGVGEGSGVVAYIHRALAEASGPTER
ncbi:MAG: FAD-dependent oxidoreductase [Amphiplicatus sp.]